MDVVDYVVILLQGVVFQWLILIERRLSKIEGFLKAMVKYSENNDDG